MPASHESVAALPLAAQADTAAESARQLNQEPLSTLSQVDGDKASGADAADTGGDSDAMHQARAALQARQAETGFAASGDDLAPGREATS